MPTYDYQCKECDEIVEYSMTVEEKDEFEPQCPECGGEMKRVFSPIPFAFSGLCKDGVCSR